MLKRLFFFFLRLSVCNVTLLIKTQVWGVRYIDTLKKHSTKEIYLYQFKDTLDLILQCDVSLKDLDFLYLKNGKVDFFSSHNSFFPPLLSLYIKRLTQPQSFKHNHFLGHTTVNITIQS